MGRCELSNEHLLAVEGRVTRHRSIRRLLDGDSCKWQCDPVKSVMSTPWNPGGESGPVRPRRVHPEPVGVECLRKEAAEGGVPVLSHAGHRPTTPGCAACARRGDASHGFHHSMACRKAYQEWLSRQVPAPVLEEIPVAPEEDIERPALRRLTRKTSPEEISERQESAKRDADLPVDRLEEEERGVQEQEMDVTQCEFGDEAELLRVLQVEADSHETTDQICMESGVDMEFLEISARMRST